MTVEAPTSAPTSAGTVRTLIDAAAAAAPDAIYAVAADGAQTITFAGLARDCAEVGRALDALGVGPGETVSTMMGNGLGTMRVLLGAMHAGRRVNPVNLLSSEEQMRHVVGHADARLVVASPEWAVRAGAVVAAVRADDPAAAPIRVLVVAADAEAKALLEAVRSPSAAAALEADRRPRPPSFAPAAAPAPTKAARSGGDDDLDADATALLMYTSGTTGVPKGVMLTHANLVANAMSISAEHQLGRQDRVLGVLPLYHINAFVVTMLAPLAHQGSVAMAAKFSAQQFWQQAIALGCTWLNVVPTIVSYLIEGPAPAREALASIRFCRSASAPLAPEHHRAFEARFGIGIVETMGLTETAAPSFSNPLEPAHRKVGSVGRASGGDARVVGADLSPVADGTTGEIVIRGPHVMRGYYKNEAATRDAFTADGWLRTGDLGHRDSDGFFFVTGRLKELIIKGGENIAPREIDEALLRHPAVLEAAATGIPDPHYGQEILACVVLRPGHGASEDELRAHCVETVGRYKAPKRIRFVDALPRGPSGKVQRLRLRDEGPAD